MVKIVWKDKSTVQLHIQTSYFYNTKSLILCKWLQLII